MQPQQSSDRVSLVSAKIASVDVYLSVKLCHKSYSDSQSGSSSFPAGNSSAMPRNSWNCTCTENH